VEGSASAIVATSFPPRAIEKLDAKPLPRRWALAGIRKPAGQFDHEVTFD
jgi:hypothetical protein